MIHFCGYEAAANAQTLRQIPSLRQQVFYALVKLLMDLESFRYQFRKHFLVQPRICLLGIRGAKASDYPNSITNVYDDVIIRYVGGDLMEFEASVDPGSHYVNHPVNPLGCARLKCGLWSYQRGEHLHAHPALIQADEVTVDRLDRKGKKLCEDSGFFGINIHSGGPEYQVGRYSAGCQIIKTAEAWKDKWVDFYLPIIAAMEIYDQKHIPYLLIDKIEAIPTS